MEIEKSFDDTGKEVILYNYDFAKGSRLNTPELNDEIKAKFNIAGISTTEDEGKVRVHSLEKLSKIKETELQEIIRVHIPQAVVEQKTVEQRLIELEAEVKTLKEVKPR